MPIQLIDTYVMPSRSQEASQVKHVESVKPVHEQIEVSNRFQQTVEHNGNQTVQATKSENKEYRYDAKEKGNSSYSESEKRKKKGKKEQKKQDTIKPMYEGGKFDMKI